MDKCFRGFPDKSGREVFAHGIESGIIGWVRIVVSLLSYSFHVAIGLYKKTDIHPRCISVISFWAESRTRTGDLFITNELLYQLSYFGDKKMSLELHFSFASAKVVLLILHTKHLLTFFENIFGYTFLSSVFTPVGSSRTCSERQLTINPFKGLKSEKEYDGQGTTKPTSTRIVPFSLVCWDRRWNGAHTIS